MQITCIHCARDIFKHITPTFYREHNSHFHLQVGGTIHFPFEFRLRIKDSYIFKNPRLKYKNIASFDVSIISPRSSPCSNQHENGKHNEPYCGNGRL